MFAIGFILKKGGGRNIEGKRRSRDAVNFSPPQ